MVPLLFPELAAPLSRSQRHQLKGSLASSLALSEALAQADGPEPSPSATAAVFHLVPLGATAAFERRGPERYARSWPSHSSVCFQTTSAKIN